MDSPTAAPRLDERALQRLERRARRRTNLLRTLVHGAVPAGPEFGRQLEHLAARHPLVSLAQVLDTFEGGHALAPGALVLAFREARSFAAHAWPALRRHAAPALLFVPPPGEAGLEPEELERLAREGVALGVQVGAEEPFTSALERLERLQRGVPRLVWYAGAPPGVARVEAARAAGVELAFQAVPGANDLRRADRLRLRAIELEPAATLEVVRARLARCAPGAPRAVRLAPPATADELRAARALRRSSARLRFVLRPLDALLTAGLAPRPGVPAALRALVRPRSAHYERLRSLAWLVLGPVPALERRVLRALLDTRALPFRVTGVERLGYGTAATVFGLQGPGAVSAHVLKVYRWTLARTAAQQAQAARRHRARYELLRGWLGAHVLRTHYLVLHGPLGAHPALACLQERIAGATDLLALGDAELAARLRVEPALAREFVAFAQRVRAVRAQGFFPDLLGPGNLLLVPPGGAARLRLIDYGLFDLRCGTAHLPRAALDAAEARLARLARELDGAD